MRRHSVCEGLEQSAEPRANHIERHAEQLEDALLRRRVVDPKASSTELIAVADDVVRMRPHVVRPLRYEGHVLIERPCEWVMRIRQPALVVLLKQVCRVDPEELPFALADQFPPPRDLMPDQADHRLGFAATIGHDEDQVVRTRAREPRDLLALLFADELVERTSGRPRKTLSACAFRDRDQLVELTPCHVLSARHRKRTHDPARRQDFAEDLDLRVAESRAEVRDLQLVTEVWLIRAVAQERILDVQSRKRQLELHAKHFVPKLGEEALDQGEHVLLIAERHLQVELCELGLTVRAQVLVSEAARYLVVALDTGHHQQLLQHLRSLRQSVEAAGM